MSGKHRKPRIPLMKNELWKEGWKTLSFKLVNSESINNIKYGKVFIHFIFNNVETLIIRNDWKLLLFSSLCKCCCVIFSKTSFPLTHLHEIKPFTKPLTSHSKYVLYTTEICTFIYVIIRQKVAFLYYPFMLYYLQARLLLNQFAYSFTH